MGEDGQGALGAPAEDAQEGADGEDASTFTPRVRVLLVEDSRVNRAVAGHFLRRLGYPVDIATNGHEALSMALRQHYDFVFMDVRMPGMDGFEATRQMRRALGPRTPYIVAMTALSLPGDRQSCMDAGMDDYLVKPTRLEAIANILAPR